MLPNIIKFWRYNLQNKFNLWNIKTKKRLTNVICAFLIGLFCLSGCAEKNTADLTNQVNDQLQQSSSIIEEKNEWTQTFDTALTKINNQESSTAAVDLLVNYMAEKFEDPPTSLDTQSTQPNNSEAIKSLINFDLVTTTELNKRTKTLTTQQSNKDHISIKTFAEQLNSQQSEIEVTESELIELRDGIRKVIPNITTTPDSELISPLESMVISWTYFTGDDGTMIPGELGQLDQEKLLKLKNNGLQTQFITVPGVVIAMLVVAIVCGIHVTTMYVLHKDIFGNKVKEDETIGFCWKRKRGRRTETVWSKKNIYHYYYTLEHLENSLSELSKSIQVRTNANQNGLATLQPTISSGLNTASFKKKFKFPYNDLYPSLKVGDIIFTKNLNNIFIRHLSNWTHVAILSNNSKEGKLFESWNNEIGTYNYDMYENWKTTHAYSIRRVSNIHSVNMKNFIAAAIKKYSNIRYIPEIKINNYPILQKIPKVTKTWSDKNDLSSMYCSKLVWNVYKDLKTDFGETINLDSNVTIIKPTIDQIKKGQDFSDLIKKDVDNYGNIIKDAYIGVTPDDIYASKFLGPDVFFEGTLN